MKAAVLGSAILVMLGPCALAPTAAAASTREPGPRFAAVREEPRGGETRTAGESVPARASRRALRARTGRGGRRAKVRLLQQGLRALGFAVGLSGRFDGATARAVLAYRKTNGLGRKRSASRTVYKMVLQGRGAFRLRYPQAGRHLEFDWSRQVLVLARAGRAERVYHASSGKSSTPTPFGTFRFYRRQRGRNSNGMVHSNYFFRGYAVHGYRSVPARPASHGCIRVPVGNASSIDRWIRRGDRIYIYR